MSDREVLGGPAKPEPTCATCEHFYSISETTRGCCRRYPPFGKEDLFPRVNVGAVCGEHQDLVAERNVDLAAAIVKALPDYERRLEAIDDNIDALRRTT